jgi:hypothetical protein
MSPFVEDVIEEQKLIWGEYLPTIGAKGLTNRSRSCVKVRGIGCVFIGTAQECQNYIRINGWKYEKKNSQRLITV